MAFLSTLYETIPTIPGDVTYITLRKLVSVIKRRAWKYLDSGKNLPTFLQFMAVYGFNGWTISLAAELKNEGNSNFVSF